MMLTKCWNCWYQNATLLCMTKPRARKKLHVIVSGWLARREAASPVLSAPSLARSVWTPWSFGLAALPLNCQMEERRKDTVHLKKYTSTISTWTVVSNTCIIKLPVSKYHQTHFETAVRVEMGIHVYISDEYYMYYVANQEFHFSIHTVHAARFRF